MRIESRLVNQRIRLGEAVRILWTIHRESDEDLDVWREPTKIAHLVDGDCEDWLERSRSDAEKVVIASGETATIETAFEPSFSKIYRDHKAIERFAYSCEITIATGAGAVVPPAPTFEVEVDLRFVEPLKTPSGLRSNYVVDGPRIFYVSDKSRAYEGRTRLLKVDPAVACTLDERYLVADGKVFGDGRPLKGLDAARFRVLSPVFATDGEVVLTSYGNAKVAEPGTFEALDTGDGSIFADDPRIGYRAGYGRDSQFVYYFDESTSTTHAVRLRGCKVPSRFVPLGRGYGKDDRSVFRGATRIDRSIPASFRVLGGQYSADERSVYFGTSRIEGADAPTFELLAGTTGSHRGWARDASRYYEHGQTRTEEEYDRALPPPTTVTSARSVMPSSS